ncbi:MAG: tRNA (guanine10-N2)-dimethyltransferase [Candidatus Woesearchaeota archaeon]|nr:tRNA (guanine10-N2)-dimethyltransferase [Candidatus Woesearchaeota archaeon]
MHQKKYLFEIDRCIRGFGQEELSTLLPEAKSISKAFSIFEGKLEKNEIDRLGLTKTVYEIIISSSEDNFINTIENVDWKEFYNRDFSVRKHRRFNCSFKEREIADVIWVALKKQGLNPKTNLKGASTELFVIKEAGIIWLCKKIWQRESFEERMPNNRPALHPSSIHPKIARAMINLSGIKSGFLVDPFCGSGGIIIEAGLLGYKVKGIDIDGAMLGRAKKNLDFFGIDAILEKKDARLFDEDCDLIVTDPPYGKNTKLVGSINELYTTFLKNAMNHCDVVVMIFPDFVNENKIVKDANARIDKQFSYYIHKSLTRHICRLVPL